MAEIRTIVGARPDGTRVVLCERCVIADSYWLRLRGLLGRGRLEPQEGLLLRPGSSIHMFFMRFAIDAVFLDADDVVLDVRPRVRPWRMAWRRGARAVLEVAEGQAAERAIEPGTRVVVEDRR